MLLSKFDSELNIFGVFADDVNHRKPERFFSEIECNFIAVKVPPSHRREYGHILHNYIKQIPNLFNLNASTILHYAGVYYPYDHNTEIHEYS